ncbi:RHE_PE00001 family protein [Neorhizobium sp. NPDC001467]|uniref:RHE_PE00001 family protein n=1 Tax=Neorhizobium sp. NPDC001467 TaxID=3390595 RepID=UPI003CFDBB9B
MDYDLTRLPLADMAGAIAAATSAVTRLDERLVHSPIRLGWLSRSHFWDACAALWVDGELVHLEDLVREVGELGARRPSQALTIAHDIVRSRRRILTHPHGWALTEAGLNRLRRGHERTEPVLEHKSARPKVAGGDDTDAGTDDPFSVHLAEIDAVLARSEALLSQIPLSGAHAVSREREDIADLIEGQKTHRDEEDCMRAWRQVLKNCGELPGVLRAVVLLDAWDRIQVLERMPWLGPLLSAAALRDSGLTTGCLLPISVGIKQVPRSDRRHRHRDTRLHALLSAVLKAAQFGLSEHDRLSLIRQQLVQRLDGRRSSSKLPQLIDLVLQQPFVSTDMIVETLDVTPQGATRIISQLNIRELTGRGRFRAWGVL